MEDRDRLVHELQERIKELTALHGAAWLLRDDSLSTEELLARIAALLPPMLQHSADGAGRVTLGDLSFATPGWRETPWRLRAGFRTGGGREGAVEAAYLRELPAEAEGPFLAEERRLVESLARMLADTIDRRRTEERLRHFVHTGRVRLFEWDIAEDRIAWPGLPLDARAGGGGVLSLSRREAEAAVHPDDRAGLFRRIDEALADPARADLGADYRATVPGGTPTWRHLTARIVRDPAGRATRVLGITVDISEQKALEEQLRQSQKLEALGRLAGGVAHDFNNLLAAIMGYAEIATGRLPEGSPAREDLGEVLKASETAAALVRQILAFGRRQELKPRRVDLRTAVAQMEGMLSSLVGRRVRLVKEFAPDAPDALVDPSQFQQVVLNLCVNARDAMPKGGSLTVRVSPRTAGAPREDGTPGAPRPWSALEVEDTGTGIPPEVRARLFEPFFTTKEVGKGTGLGLATVHGIVAQSGGFLEVDSEVGRGTTFRAMFPVAE